jgi:hypothetical protein
MRDTGSPFFSGRLLPRRDFLKISSAAVIGAAATALTPGALLIPLERSDAPLLGIGWAAAPPTENAASVRLGDARRLVFGDSRFAANRVRLAIAPSAGHVVSDVGNALEVIYPSESRYHAWSTMPHYVSPGVNLTVPMAGNRLQFAVGRSRPSADKGAPRVNEESILTLTTGSSSGVAKLKKGVYVIAFREKEGQKVDWSRCALARNSDGRLLVTGASFAHAIMTVDYA